jgi:hypothetical protein
MITKTTKIIKRVAFFGDADAKKNDQHFEDAYNTAKLLAENGYIIVNGGGPGVMLASTLGAKAGNGRAEIVIIDEKVDMGENYEGSGTDNKAKADKIYRTNNIQNRTNKLVEIADAFVVFKGGTGTLSEVGLVWEIAKFNYGKHEPVIFFGKEWKEIVETMIRELDFEKKEQKVVALIDSSEEVLEIIKNGRQSKKISIFEKLVKFVKKN